MKIVKFNCNGYNSPAYGCNKPGDNSGEYVDADIAQDLYDMLLYVLAEMDHNPILEADIQDVLTKADKD